MNVAVAARGQFGSALAAELTRMLPAIRMFEDMVADWSDLTACDLLLAALSKEEITLVTKLDDACREQECVLLPIVMESLDVRVGPWCGAGAGSCYECFLKRVWQHDEQAPLTKAVHLAFDAPDGPEVLGFLPPQVASVAALVAAVVYRYPSKSQLGDRDVLYWNSLSMTTSTASIVSTHGCARCRGEKATL